MTPSTYLQMPVNLQRLCHYAVIKWNISSKYLDIKRKRALNLILLGFYRSASAVLFHFSPRNLDLDRLRQPYQATEWHNLYYMHGDSGAGWGASVEKIWWVNGKELCLIWDGSCCSVYLHHAVNLPGNCCKFDQQPQKRTEETQTQFLSVQSIKSIFTWNKLAGRHVPMGNLMGADTQHTCRPVNTNLITNKNKN